MAFPRRPVVAPSSTGWIALKFVQEIDEATGLPRAITAYIDFQPVGPDNKPLGDARHHELTAHLTGPQATQVTNLLTNLRGRLDGEAY